MVIKSDEIEEKNIISVIIPIYRVEKYLNKCVDSVLNQTHRNIQVILVDDGSPDNCPAICDEYAKKDRRVKVIHKKNGGLSDARNCGLQYAIGEYISFVDSDDYLDVRMLEILYNMVKEENCDLAIVGFKTFYENNQAEPRYSKKTVILSKEQAVLELFKQNSFGNYAWNKLYKASLFKNIKFTVCKKLEDIGTAYKIIEQSSKIVYNSSKLYFYLQREGSILHNNMDFKIYYDKYELEEERYLYLNEKYPGMIENKIYFYDSILNIYHFFENDKVTREKMDNYLNLMNINLFFRLRFNAKIKYLMYKLNKNLYIKYRKRG